MAKRKYTLEEALKICEAFGNDDRGVPGIDVSSDECNVTCREEDPELFKQCHKECFPGKPVPGFEEEEEAPEPKPRRKKSRKKVSKAPEQADETPEQADETDEAPEPKKKRKRASKPSKKTEEEKNEDEPIGKESCIACEGSGENSRGNTCRACKGSGFVNVTVETPEPAESEEDPEEVSNANEEAEDPHDAVQEQPKPAKSKRVTKRDAIAECLKAADEPLSRNEIDEYTKDATGKDNVSADVLFMLKFGVAIGAIVLEDGKYTLVL